MDLLDSFIDVILHVNVTCFDSIELKHIPKEIKTFIGNKNIIANIFRV